jgi:hypothetical protein
MFDSTGTAEATVRELTSLYQNMQIAFEKMHKKAGESI